MCMMYVLVDMWCVYNVCGVMFVVGYVCVCLCVVIWCA